MRILSLLRGATLALSLVAVTAGFVGSASAAQQAQSPYDSPDFVVGSNNLP